MSLAKYISEFEMIITELKSFKVTLPESLLAFRLLRYANLPEEVARIVRIACNTNARGAEAMTLDNMKATILNAFDCRLEPKAVGSSSSSCRDIEMSSPAVVEPFQIKSEPLETYYARGQYGNDRERNSNHRKFRGSGKSSFRGSGQRQSTEPYPTNRYRRDSDR